MRMEISTDPSSFTISSTVSTMPFFATIFSIMTFYFEIKNDHRPWLHRVKSGRIGNCSRPAS